MAVWAAEASPAHAVRAAARPRGRARARRVDGGGGAGSGRSERRDQWSPVAGRGETSVTRVSIELEEICGTGPVSRAGRRIRRGSGIRAGWPLGGATSTSWSTIGALEVLAAPGAQRPVELDQARAVGADAAQSVAAGGADDPVLVHLPPAVGAVRLGLDLDHHRLFGEGPLVGLGDGLARAAGCGRR